MSRATRLAVLTGDRAPDLTADGQALVAALAARGVDAEPVRWDDPGVEWGRYDAALFRSCWEYPSDIDRFRTLLDELEPAPLSVYNPLAAVRWNLHKSYLTDLDVPAPATTVIEQGSSVALEDVLAERGWDEAVVKPAVGTSSEGVRRVRAADAAAHEDVVADLLAAGDVVVQAFASAVTEGERSVVFVDGVYSHAWNSRPAADDVTTFEGADTDYQPAPATVARARQALVDAREAAGVDRLPYARVDFVGEAESFRLMEVELVKPYLGLDRGPGPDDERTAPVERLCTALTARLQ